MRLLTASLTACVLLVSGAAAAAPRIELYTMGPGDDIFSTFGHAAICVDEDGRGQCYNYGTTDFSTPIPLTWDFLRGRAQFWVSVWDRDAMIRAYEHANRTVYRQRLPLGPAAAQRLAAALADSTDERVKYYRYHHFNDNCTTRIRGLLDAATGGALRANPVPAGRTFREWSRTGFAGHWPLLAITDLLLGRPADRATDSWSAMFLPSELRREVARRLHAPVEVLFERAPAPAPGATWLGDAAFAAAGALLALLVAAGARLGRAGTRLRRAGRRAAVAVVGTTLGLFGVLLYLLAILSDFPELRWNESLLALWPTDLVLPWLGARTLRRYAMARLGVLALLLAGHAAGLTQPLAPLLLPALPFAALLVISFRPAEAAEPTAPVEPALVTPA